MSAAPAKKSARRTAAKKPAAKRPTAANERPQPERPDVPASAAAEVCPRCGTTKFGPEERTRWEARRTVRYTVLVCERGHTFAHPVTRAG